MMELTYHEFLVSSGAVVRLRSDYEPELFADLLDEFFADNLDKAIRQQMKQ